MAHYLKKLMESESSNMEISEASVGANEKHDLWYYSENDMIQTPSIFLNSVPFYIKVAVKSSDEQEELFAISGSPEIKLEEIFRHFIKVKGKKSGLDLFDENQLSFGWKFYTKGFMNLRQRELNTSLSLRKNQVKKMAVIVARRF